MTKSELRNEINKQFDKIIFSSITTKMELKNFINSMFNKIKNQF